MARTHSVFFFVLIFPSDMAWRKRWKTELPWSKGPGIQVPLLTPQRARTNFPTKFATNSLFTLLPHRSVSVLCYMALYVFARLWAAVLDGWLAYNKSCFNSSSMHICFGTFFCNVSFYPFTTHYWFAPCHCQDRPMGTSSDWSKIKKKPLRTTPRWSNTCNDGQSKTTPTHFRIHSNKTHRYKHLRRRICCAY
jgi:hypothetical protein